MTAACEKHGAPLASCTRCEAEAAACIAMTDEAVLAHVRAHLAESDAVAFGPFEGALDVPSDEPALAVYDARFVVTAKRLVLQATSIEWASLDPEQMYAQGSLLVLREDASLDLGDDVDACLAAFTVLAISARRTRPNESGVVPRVPSSHANATPPPPHAVSFQSYAVHAATQRGPAFACWSCKTPLYASTPRCSRCGAQPKAEGWLRTG